MKPARNFSMSPLKFLKSRLARFARQEEGTIMAETVIILPMMLWALLAMFVYWDAFRSANILQKSSYTVSDIISREMVPVTDSYITGMRDVMKYMMNEGDIPRLRVTSIGFSGTNRRFEVMWSRSTSSKLTPLTTMALQSLASRIPKMAEGDYAVIVESELDYSPSFNVGLDNMVFKQFIVTRPRYVSPTCMTGASRCTF